MDKKEEVERIFDRAKFEALALLLAEPPQATGAEESLPEWLTEEQLMRYWQLDSTAGIKSWRKRAADKFPLPHGRLGDKVRYNRTECDRWAREEAARNSNGVKKSKQPQRHALSVVSQGAK